MHALNASRGESPYFLAFGQESRFALGLELGLEPTRLRGSRLTVTADGRDVLESFERLRKESAELERQAAERRAAVWVQGKPAPKVFGVGMPVLYYRPTEDAGIARKFAAHWKGPFRVVRRFDKDRHLSSVPATWCRSASTRSRKFSIGG
jgi:hypothetical protein